MKDKAAPKPDPSTPLGLLIDRIGEKKARIAIDTLEAESRRRATKNAIPIIDFSEPYGIFAKLSQDTTRVENQETNGPNRKFPQEPSSDNQP